MGPMECAVNSIEMAINVYTKDLDALSDEQVLVPVAGSARTAVDITYEVAVINQRIATQLMGMQPPVQPDSDGWTVAPPELQFKAAILDYFRKMGAELMDAAKSLSEEESTKMVGTPGRERPAFALAQFAATHMMYHDGQLNLMQSVCGDLAMHWN